MTSPAIAELLRRTTALRALACELVGEANADDILQEAAIQTMTAPPKRSGPVGGWLASVVRNLASKQQRAERIRHGHESKAARAEAAAPDRGAEDSDTLRKLTEVVTSLPEPYRGTILARYLREQTPSEIAAATDTPLRTVKTRLQRGLALLRERLDERDRDWRALFVGAFALDPSLATKGPTSIGTTMKLSIYAVVLLPLCLAIWAWMPNSAQAPNASSMKLSGSPMGSDAPASQSASEGEALQATIASDLDPSVATGSPPPRDLDETAPLMRLDLLGPAAFREAFLPTNIGGLMASEEGEALWRPLLAPVEAIWQQWNGDAEFESTRERVLEYAGRIRVLWFVDPGEGEELDRVSGILALERDGSTDLDALSADISRIMQGYLPGEITEQEFGQYALQSLGVPSGEILTLPILIDGVLVTFFGDAASLEQSIPRSLRALAAESMEPSAPMSLEIDLSQLQGLSEMRRVPPLVKAFGLKSLESLHAVIRPNGPQAELAVDVQFADGERGFMDALLPPVEDLPQLLGRIPANTTPWFALPFRLDELYRVAVATAAEFGAGSGEGNEPRMDEELNRELGFDLAGELLDHLGGEIMILGDLWQEEDPETFREGDDPPIGACIAFRLSDTEAFHGGFNKLLEYWKGAVTVFETRAVNGVKVTRLGVAFMTGIHLALGQDLVAVGFGTEGVEQLESL
ncbi:MAG: RNA polymerase sigma factor, partial [Planctomycetota bacterium]